MYQSGSNVVTDPSVPAGIGVAVGRDMWYGALVAPGRPVRQVSGRFGADATLMSVLSQLPDRLGCPVQVIGISHPDPEAVRTFSQTTNIPVVHIWPTVATLAGLQCGEPAASTVLVAATTTPVVDQGPALLKIGPSEVSWAAAGMTDRWMVPATTPGCSSPEALEFAAFVGSPANEDPLMLLDKPGWLSMARFLDSQPESLAPQPLTRERMDLALRGPAELRMFVSHLCTFAQWSDPFAVAVARRMGELLAAVLVHVATWKNVGRLFVQYNAIAAVGGTAAWMMRATGGGLAPLLTNGTNLLGVLPQHTTVELLCPRPWVQEAVGAYLGAAKQLVPAVI